MKVLIFSPEKPYTGAESLVTGKLMRAMMNKGWQVDMIYYEAELIYKADKDPMSILSSCHGINNSLLNKVVNKFEKVPFLNKIYFLNSIFWILKAFFYALKLNRSKKYDLVLSRIMPQYGHLPAYFFTLITKTKWIANWSDPLPLQKAPEPYGNGLEAKVSSFQMAYLKLIIGKATWNTFPSKRLLDYYREYLPSLAKNSFVLPHIIIKNRQDTSSDKILKHSAVPNSIIITHVGGFGLRNPSNLIHAVHQVYNSEKLSTKIRFRFIGYIDPYISELIQKLNLESIFSLEGVQSYEDTLNAVNSSDIMLVIEAPLKEGIFFPSKVSDYLQFRKPILAISPKIGIMNDILSIYGGGIAVDNSSVESIKSALIEISKEFHNNKLNANKYNTQNLASQYSEDKILDKIMAV